MDARGSIQYLLHNVHNLYIFAKKKQLMKRYETMDLKKRLSLVNNPSCRACSSQ